jgi:catechol 2,3-dioxygenase
MPTQSPVCVGHVHLKVRDLARSLDFYREILGLSVTERQGRFAFLSWDERHHDVALQETRPDAGTPSHADVGLYHAAMEVTDTDTLRAIHQRLVDRDVRVSPVDHGISKALYFDDPDGNGLEVYLDTRAETGQDQWEGTTAHFDPTTL